MSNRIKIVLPDTGPLITLAQADALDALLIFGADHFQLVVTDMVDFEASRQRSARADAQRIADFIERHMGRVVFEETSFGRMAISAAKTYERYTQSQQVRDFYAANQMPVPSPVAPNSGEMSINSYVMGLIGQPPGPPCLVIAEDDFFLRSTPGALPGNAHIISTARLLAKIEELNPCFNARRVLDSAAEFAGRNPNRAGVDTPAAKLKGGTTWSESLNAASLTRKLSKRPVGALRSDRAKNASDRKS